MRVARSASLVSATNYELAGISLSLSSSLLSSAGLPLMNALVKIVRKKTWGEKENCNAGSISRDREREKECSRRSGASERAKRAVAKDRVGKGDGGRQERHAGLRRRVYARLSLNYRLSAWRRLRNSHWSNYRRKVAIDVRSEWRNFSNGRGRRRAARRCRLSSLRVFPISLNRELTTGRRRRRCDLRRIIPRSVPAISLPTPCN